MLYYSVMEHVVNRPKLKKPQYADCYDRTYKIRFHNCRIRQDATNPKQKAVIDYEEQVDRHIPLHPIHRKTKKQENQCNHNGHNNQKRNQ